MVRFASCMTEENGIIAIPMTLSFPNTDLCLATTWISANSQFGSVLCYGGEVYKKKSGDG